VMIGLWVTFYRPPYPLDSLECLTVNGNVRSPASRNDDRSMGDEGSLGSKFKTHIIGMPCPPEEHGKAIYLPER